MEASLGNLGEGSYAGGLCVEEGSGRGVSPCRGPVGRPGEGCPSTGNLETLGIGRLSLKRLTAEGLEGGFLYWAPWVSKGWLRGRESLFMGAQLGDLEWALLPGTLTDERGSGGGAFLWELCEGNWEGGDPGG